MEPTRRPGKAKKKESSLFRTVMVIGTAVMLLVIAYDVYKMKLEEDAKLAQTLAQPSMAIVQTESLKSYLDAQVKNSAAPDSALASVMLQGMEVSNAFPHCCCVSVELAQYYTM